MSQKKHAAMAGNKELLNGEWHEAIVRIDILINPDKCDCNAEREREFDSYRINEQNSAIILSLM